VLWCMIELDQLSHLVSKTDFIKFRTLIFWLLGLYLTLGF